MYYGAMAATSSAVGFSDEEIVRRAVDAETGVPEFIVGHNVESIDDYTGEPAVQVTFFVKTGTPGGLNTGRILRQLADSVQNRAKSLGVTRFPYVRFGERV
jgi:hypothetical protein